MKENSIIQNKDHEHISVNLVAHLISVLFKNVQKSTVHCQTTGKLLQSYKNISILPSVCNKEIPFESVYKMLPPNWFIFHKDSISVTFGHLSEVRFNGQPSTLYLKLTACNSVSVEMDHTPIDLKEYYIPDTIRYTNSSIPALFHCMSILQPCQGYEILKQDEHSLSDSSKCIKVQMQSGNNITYILKHKDCIRCLKLQLKSSTTCKKCTVFVRNRKKLQKVGEKENKIPKPLSKDEILIKLKILAPNLHDNQLSLMQSQIVASNINNKKGMRWDKEIICMSLSLYNRNPAVYRDLTLNKWLLLPSEQLLKVYKHAVQQKPGIVPNMMQWMYNESMRQISIPEGYYGGIILDEMAIQEDLQIIHTGQSSELYGLTFTGGDLGKMQALNNGEITDCQLANHVQQYVFTGLTGFRWPFANFPNTQAPPAEIFITTWMCIDELIKWGFKPIYCCMDGSANNRAFLKMHFSKSDPLSMKMVAKYYKNPTKKIVFMMDPCHLIKKIRNSVLSSGFLQSHQRLLTVDGHFVIWKMWIDAYQWDRSTNTFPIHHKLSDEHLFPTNAQKMRNKLAFQVLDNDMLHLMRCYSSTLNDTCQAEMIGVLEFLKYTSFFVSFFTDSRPIKDRNDPRLNSLTESYNWFKSWEKQEISDNEPNKRYKSLLTMETREDLDYMYYGFISLVEICTNELNIELVPSRVNSDIIENVFCQERSLYHGANTNPNYNEYRTGINSIILGQTTTSRKSNAGGETAKPFAIGPPSKKFKHTSKYK